MCPPKRHASSRLHGSRFSCNADCRQHTLHLISYPKTRLMSKTQQAFCSSTCATYARDALRTVHCGTCRLSHQNQCPTTVVRRVVATGPTKGLSGVARTVVRVWVTTGPTNLQGRTRWIRDGAWMGAGALAEESCLTQETMHAKILLIQARCTGFTSPPCGTAPPAEFSRCLHPAGELFLTG